MTAESLASFALPSSALSSGFEFNSSYDKILESIAATNSIDIEWSLLQDIIKFKLSENMLKYLQPGPPWPISPEQAIDARSRAFASLDSFTGAPFTIQRLSELLLAPNFYYTSLPKYLRALNRVLNVSSERNAYTEDDSSFASGSGPFSDEKTSAYEEDRSFAAASTSDAGMTPTKRPAPLPSVSPSPSSSRSSTPIPQQPLLSPIPWLVTTSPAASSSPSSVTSNTPNPLPSSSPPHHSALSTSSNSNSSTTTPILNQSKTLTPTGGLVDEVDPGSGNSDIVEPIVLSSLEVPGQGNSLRDRFVRAGSPRVNDDDEENKDKKGIEDVSM